MKKMIIGLLVVALSALTIMFSPSAALANGSDGELPYSVDVTGVTLLNGATFEANGHVNFRTTLRNGGTHFDPNNNQPGGAFIGASFFPIELSPGECITWVQISQFNEHFGEGGQEPVCAPEEPPVVVDPPFEAYEVCATWLINAPAPEIWPNQTLLSRECGFLPVPECVDIRVQTDKYWVRDETDEAYWLALTVLNSGADDATLEPHDYEVITVPAKDCTVPPVEPPVEEPPVVTPPVEPPVVVPPVVTEPPVTVETPLVPIPAEEPVATQPVSKVTVERLPETGGEFDWTWWMIGGILLMGAGIVAVNLGMRKED